MAGELELQGALKRTKKGSADWYYGGGEEAWTSKASAYAGIPLSIRPGKVFGVWEAGVLVEYKWSNENQYGDGQEVKATVEIPEDLVQSVADAQQTANDALGATQTFQQAVDQLSNATSDASTLAQQAYELAENNAFQAIAENEAGVSHPAFTTAREAIMWMLANGTVGSQQDTWQELTGEMWDVSQIGSAIYTTISADKNITISNPKSIQVLSVTNTGEYTLTINGQEIEINSNGETDIVVKYFSGEYHIVTNAAANIPSDTTAPVLQSITVTDANKYRVTLLFNEMMSSGLTASDITISNKTISTVTVSGLNIYVDVVEPFSYNENETISGGAGKIKDLNGNALANLINEPIVNTIPAVDNSAPVLLTASVSNANRTRIDLVLNEPILVTFDNTDFIVPGKSVTAVTVAGSHIYVDVASSFAYGDTITISGGNNKIKDSSNNIAANLSNQAVVNNIIADGDSLAPSLVSAIVSGSSPNAIVLKFNETLGDASFINSDFTVSTKTISNITKLGDTITVTVSAPFITGESLTISGGAGKIKDTAGNISANLSSVAITNNVSDYHEVAQAFFTRLEAASYTPSTTEKNSINAMITGLESDGILNKVEAFWPRLGGSAGPAALNLISNNFNSTFSGGVTFNSNGVHYDGVNGYANNNLIPHTVMSSSQCTFGLVILENIANDSNYSHFGATVNGTRQTLMQLKSNRSSLFVMASKVTGAIVADVSGVWIMTQRHNLANEYEFLVFKDGVSVGYFKDAIGSVDDLALLPNIPIYEGCKNNAGTPSEFLAHTLKCSFALNTPLSDADVLSLTNRIKTFLTAIGR